MVVEKYFYNHNLTGTIIIDNVNVKTRIQIITSSGASGIFGLGGEYKEHRFKKQLTNIFKENIEE